MCAPPVSAVERCSMPQHGRGASSSWQQASTWLTRMICSQKNVSCDKQQLQDWWSIHLQGPWDEKWLNQIVALIMASLSWISHKLQSSSVQNPHWHIIQTFRGAQRVKVNTGCTLPCAALPIARHGGWWQCPPTQLIDSKRGFVGASIPSLQVVVKTHYGANTWRRISHNLGTDVYSWLYIVWCSMYRIIITITRLPCILQCVLLCFHSFPSFASHYI